MARACWSATFMLRTFPHAESAPSRASKVVPPPAPPAASPSSLALESSKSSHHCHKLLPRPPTLLPAGSTLLQLLEHLLCLALRRDNAVPRDSGACDVPVYLFRNSCCGLLDLLKCHAHSCLGLFACAVSASLQTRLTALSGEPRWRSIPCERIAQGLDPRWPTKRCMLRNPSRSRPERGRHETVGHNFTVELERLTANFPRCRRTCNHAP